MSIQGLGYYVGLVAKDNEKGNHVIIIGNTKNTKMTDNITKAKGDTDGL